MRRVGPLDAVQRRHGQVDEATLDEGAHVPVDEREQQRGNMLAVHVGVGHEHDLVVPQLVDVELVPDAGAKRRNQALDRIGGEGAVEARLFDVEDLSADRHDRLVRGVAAVDGGAACRVTLDNEDLALLGVARGAVLELAGHGRRFQDGLAAGGLARLAGRKARRIGLVRLPHDLLGFGRMRVEPVGKVGVRLLLHEGARLGVAELRLRLSLELGLAQLDRDDHREALADVVAREVRVLLLEEALVARVLVDDRGQRRTEALFVGAAFGGVDGVGERVQRLGVRRRPLHRDLSREPLLLVLRLEVDGIRVEDLHLLHLVEVLDVIEQATRVVVGNLGATLDRIVSRARSVARDLVALGNGRRALVDERDAQALVEEGHLMEAAAQGLEVEVRGLEDLCVRPERLRGAGFVSLFAALERCDGHAVLVGNAPDVAVAANLCIHALGERVHHRDAHAVQAAGDGVAALSELAASVQHGHDDLNCGKTLGGVDVDGDAAAVVHNAHAAVLQQRDLDVIAVSGERLVDRVVHDLVHEVVQAALTRGADVHARALAHSLKALEDRDVGSVVGLIRRDRSSPVWGGSTRGVLGGFAADLVCHALAPTVADADPRLRTQVARAFGGFQSVA